MIRLHCGSLFAYIAGYFDSVASEFEIKERMDAINKKIDYAQEVQSTLRALLTEVCCNFHSSPV